MREASRLPLHDLDLDEGYSLLHEQAVFAVSSATDRLSLRMLEGYTNAQVFAPRDHDVVAFEPMTAPTDALNSGDGLRLVEPGRTFRAAFQICVEHGG
jgi:galactose mutarotase-like enzyme